MPEIPDRTAPEDLAADVETRSLRAQITAQQTALVEAMARVAATEAEILQLEKELEQARAPRPPIAPEARDAYVLLELERAIACEQGLWPKLVDEGGGGVSSVMFDVTG